MQSFQRFLESKKGEDSSYQLKAVTDLASALKHVFDKYTMTTRGKAWDKITSKKGDAEVRRLIRNPSLNLSSFRTL